MLDELHTLSTLVGMPVLAAERSAWGFENRTDIVTLAGGRKLVVQRISNPALAPHKLRLAQQLPERLAAVGLRLPRVLRADAIARPPFAVREYLPGTLAASAMRDDQSAIAVAAAMGAVLRQLRQVDTHGLRLHSGWATPLRRARQARAQVGRCGDLLDTEARRLLTATIDQLEECFDGRGNCFAHGDFCPVNALLAMDGETSDRWSVVALLDVEFARLADPLFDAAWWGWVVRYHHPQLWMVAWPALLAAAGIAADSGTLGRILALQQLRCLEALDYARAAGPDAATQWVRRLQETLGWPAT
jgi:aminoglycoside phosphotransferase (APT) family kinase protein